MTDELPRYPVSMKKPQSFYLLSVQILLFFSTVENIIEVDGQCINDQRSHLLHLKNSLTFQLELSTRLVQWNPKEDCCSWKGVGCDSFGRVITLELDHESISGRENNLTSLFKLQFLQNLNLGFTNVIGIRIPKEIGNLTNLVYLNFSNSGFVGQIPIELSRLRKLTFLDLSLNQFNGLFPKFLFELKKLKVLLLSSNSFTDTIQLKTFMNLPNLTRLELSYNNLTVDPRGYNSSVAGLTVLKLASCKLQSIPELKGHAWLSYLDLSHNEITGEIPNWIWSLGLRHVDLSLNFFQGLQKQYETPPTLGAKDVHSNQLQGEVPIRPTISQYADLSGNKFSGTIPSLIELDLCSSLFLSVSNNSLTGSIPDSICNATNLRVLDLSFNALNVTIPSCLMISGSLRVLNLAGNNLSGSIPDTFSGNCSLISLDLGMNFLQGKLPRTLSNCTLLEVLNLGYNKIEDSFPCMLENSFSLKVLSLRSNKFHGGLECFGYNYSWPRLQVIDVASNNFSGVLSPEFFSSLKNAIFQEPSRGDHLITFLDLYYYYYYRFNVTVMMIGREMKLGTILTIFPAIDLSSNSFSGKIPESIGDVMVLYVLNLSHNVFTGGIPSSIGKLQNLGSLDLSMNNLTGEIPTSLVNLTFLSFLDLSFNILTGKIPTGSQFQTFSMDTYMGNVGLCGFPSNVSCGNVDASGSSIIPSLSNKNEIDLVLYLTTMGGYIVGLWIFFVMVLFGGWWKVKLFHQIDQLLLKVLSKRLKMRIGPEWREPIRRL